MTTRPHDHQTLVRQEVSSIKICFKASNIQVITLVDVSAHTAISCGTYIARGSVFLKTVASLTLAAGSMKL